MSKTSYRKSYQDKMMTIEELNKITEKIIGCAIEVHRTLGPGLLESIYERALCYEFTVNNINYQNQMIVPIIYKETTLGNNVIDILVENEVIVEIKAVERMNPLYEAQLLSYMRLCDKKLGLLINFNVPYLREGIKRMIL